MLAVPVGTTKERTMTMKKPLIEWADLRSALFALALVAAPASFRNVSVFCTAGYFLCAAGALLAERRSR